MKKPWELEDERYQELFEKVRDAIADKPLRLQAADLPDELIDEVILLAKDVIDRAGGLCSYEWHFREFEEPSENAADRNRCCMCGKPRDQHVSRLACPEETE